MNECVSIQNTHIMYGMSGYIDADRNLELANSRRAAALSWAKGPAWLGSLGRENEGHGT